MATPALRLPGVTFEAPTPAPEEGLPRMDVAAFVGFAAAGPLHTPVAVESARRFRDVFGPDPAHGPDPALAWDDERGEQRRAHLGGAVEAFFANGGVRAWVVRVADRQQAVRHVFRVPGLIAADTRDDSPVPAVEARARAAGSWCEDLAVGTALFRDPLRLRSDLAGPPIVLAIGGYHVNLSAERSRVQPGDLLEVTFGATGPVLLLFAERVTAVPGGLRVESAAATAGVTAGAFWVQPAAITSPPADAADPDSTPPLPLAEADGLAAALGALGSPAVRPTVRRLSFELLVFRGTEQHRRLGDLAFGSAHPRFWATLPLDEELFELPIGVAVPTEPVGLAREASSPRFPLAGPEGAPAAYYLPWGMGRQRRPEAALGLDAEDTAGSSALERDGLAVFGPGLFVDERLARVGAGALLGEAEHRFYVARQRLLGIHSLLPIEEASLVAVPDAVHRGWSRELPEEPSPLGAPTLDAIPEADSAGRHHLGWSAVAGAQDYALQWDLDPAFPAAVPAFEGEDLQAAVTLPEACPREVFFRVRALREGEVGPWSNTRVARLPQEDFAPCEPGRPGALVLDFTGDSSPGPALTWTTEDASLPLPDAWQIEVATDAGFAAASEYAPDDMVQGYAPLPRRRFAARYYRVRGVQDGVHGPWSNTVRVGATERAAFTEIAVREFDATALLAVHRALLRFAAARGDLLAVLSLPDHFRTAEALEHAGRLTPGGPEEEPAPAPPAPLFPRVQPLTEGEAPVLSFGALYHPWTVTRAGTAADAPLRRLPPDGAASGLMAEVALVGGAWRAPANRALAGVLALDPTLGPGAWGQLVSARVNTLLNDPRGFLTLSEETLGGEGGLERIHIRRLMTLLRRLALREGQRFVFEPHGAALLRQVQALFERFLGALFQRGAFAGSDASEAFRVVTDATVNPPASVERGRLVVELRVAPAAALNFLTVRLVTTGPAGLAVEEA
jgi:hypothetical protein